MFEQFKGMRVRGWGEQSRRERERERERRWKSAEELNICSIV
jgi:hypothetical protein